ncbi:glycosyltransferase family 2 protein [Algoriphagus machipongonensis]|uniref:glycosyltransferase family 2 protein n=1 Tax=Algoriphagus machipongonensis TaxID=388413 RepID=UPI0000F393F0|nr:glycosyltransferase family 2 protein [Algoriphagus machipongonensis]
MISVIVPFYNNEDFLKETLISVSQQTIENWECVLVDDGSTDNSLKLAKAFASEDARFKCFTRPSELPKGANSCRNFGVEKCRGSHLLFLDADDLLSSKCLELRECKIRNEDLVVFSTAHFTGDIKDGFPFFSNLDLDLTSIEYRNMFLDYVIPWHGSSGIWSKRFFVEIGGFDPELLRFQDVDLHVRALNAKGISLKLDYSDGFTSFYRKSLYHQKVTLEKRRFILNQGMLYASKMKRELDSKDYRWLEGLFVYLLFRFEEVFDQKDLQKIQEWCDLTGGEKDVAFSSEFIFMMKMYKSILTKPNRLRKYASYFLYRKYGKNKYN